MNALTNHYQYTHYPKEHIHSNVTTNASEVFDEHNPQSTNHQLVTHFHYTTIKQTQQSFSPTSTPNDHLSHQSVAQLLQTINIIHFMKEQAKTKETFIEKKKKYIKKLENQAEDMEENIRRQNLQYLKTFTKMRERRLRQRRKELTVSKVLREKTQELKVEIKNMFRIMRNGGSKDSSRSINKNSTQVNRKGISVIIDSKQVKKKSRQVIMFKQGVFSGSATKEASGNLRDKRQLNRNKRIKYIPITSHQYHPHHNIHPPHIHQQQQIQHHHQMPQQQRYRYEDQIASTPFHPLKHTSHSLDPQTKASQNHHQKIRSSNKSSPARKSLKNVNKSNQNRSGMVCYVEQVKLGLDAQKQHKQQREYLSCMQNKEKQSSKEELEQKSRTSGEEVEQMQESFTNSVYITEQRPANKRKAGFQINIHNMQNSFYCRHSHDEQQRGDQTTRSKEKQDGNCQAEVSWSSKKSLMGESLLKIDINDTIKSRSTNPKNNQPALLYSQHTPSLPFANHKGLPVENSKILDQGLSMDGNSGLLQQGVSMDEQEDDFINSIKLQTESKFSRNRNINSNSVQEGDILDGITLFGESKISLIIKSKIETKLHYHQHQHHPSTLHTRIANQQLTKSSVVPKQQYREHDRLEQRGQCRLNGNGEQRGQCGLSVCGERKMNLSMKQVGWIQQQLNEQSSSSPNSKRQLDLQ